MCFCVQRLCLPSTYFTIIFNLRRSNHITDALISLHWPRVPERITFKVATLTYRALHGVVIHVSPTCRTDAGSGPPPRNNLTFRPVVGPLSEVVPFLLLQQRCGMACQAMLRQPRRCRCSRTGWRHSCSAAATKLIDFEWHFLFLVIISPPEQWSLQ